MLDTPRVPCFSPRPALRWPRPWLTTGCGHPSAAIASRSGPRPPSRLPASRTTSSTLGRWSSWASQRCNHTVRLRTYLPQWHVVRCCHLAESLQVSNPSSWRGGMEEGFLNCARTLSSNPSYNGLLAMATHGMAKTWAHESARLWLHESARLWLHESARLWHHESTSLWHHESARQCTCRLV